MAGDAADLRLSGRRRCFGAGHRHRACHESDRADLGREAGDREPAAGADRISSQLGHRPRLSRGRKSGALARPSRQASAVAREGAQVEHHSALALRRIAGIHGGLREQEGIAARALEFTILTAARTGETIGATVEIDTRASGPSRPTHESRQEHRVPLSDRAFEIMATAPQRTTILSSLVATGATAQQHGDAQAFGAHGTR